MKKLIALAGLMLWAAPLMAETYSWVDENGTTNFTEDVSRVPKKYRKKMKTREDIPSQSTTVAPENQKATPAEKAISLGSDTGGANGGTASGKELFGGKTREQWQSEMTSQAAEMNALLRQLKDLEALAAKPGISRERSISLPGEHAELQKKYNASVSRYNALIDSAKKAGLQVELKN